MAGKKAKQVTSAPAKRSKLAGRRQPAQPAIKPPPRFMTEHKVLSTLCMAMIQVAALFLLYYSNFGAVTEWVGAIVVLMIGGDIIARVNNLQNLAGMYMLGSAHGIGIVDYLSKHNVKFWRFMADWGLVLGFGILAWPLFKKYLGRKTYAAGVVSIILMLFLVYPYLSYTLGFLNLPQVTSKISQPTATSSVGGLSVTGIVVYAAGIAGGFTAFTIIGIGYNALSVLYSVISTAYNVGVLHNANNTIAQQIPGVAPLIPGITIPLFAGIISLVIILIVHEFSHGVLARLVKVKIKSIGLVLFGVIPAGAFVEPDEASIKKLSEQSQNRIFIAGVSSNILLSLIFFVLFITFLLYIMPALLTTKVIVAATVPGSAASVLPTNSTILDWNNYPIKNISSFTVAAKNDTPYSKVSVVTDGGSYLLTANATGKVGVYVNQVSVPLNPGTGFNIVNFLYAVVSLSFLLNFLVGVVNMLPIPGLDGWRVYQTKIKDKRIMSALTWLVVLLILLNIVPWFFIQ